MKKNRSIRDFIFDLVMINLTGGLWLAWIIIR